ncbi:MAG TPA: sigma-70 family RNA polymerase sigma factor [Planctomycetota bacterium]|nr:sigma-70 family RNA polymerase sigma factor [Planctomycetota bacterium]
MNTTESRPLVLRVQNGDLSALDELLAQHLPGLRAYIRLRCGAALRARESASDIAQSACRDVLENLDRFQWNGEAGFKAWLYTTALRKIADRAEYWGAQKRDAKRDIPMELLAGSRGGGEAPLADLYRGIASPSQNAAGREALERLEAAFDKLDEEQREIIVMARIAGLSHAEIGERLQCTAGNARLKLFRALAALSEELDGGGAGS